MLKKVKLVFDNCKQNPFANILTFGIMLVSLLISFVFARSIKSSLPEIKYFSTLLVVVLYCIIIAFGVLNVVFSYMYLFKKLEKRLYLYRIIGATKLDIVFVQFLEVFVKYNIVFAIAILISEFLFGLAEGQYFPALVGMENLIIYFVMLVVTILSVILTLVAILFGKNTITNKEFL